MANDHYVSQFYLRKFGFVNDHNPQQFDTFVYFLNEGVCKRKGIRKIAARANLFNPDIEAGFSRFETRASSVLGKIERNVNRKKRGHPDLEDISQDERHTLIKLIEFQYRRSLTVHQEFYDELDRLIDPIQSDLIEEYGENVMSIPEVRDMFQNRYQIATQDFASRFFQPFRFQDGESDIDFENLLLSRNWYVLFIDSSEPAEFVSCDVPIYRFNPHGPDGVAYESTQVLFPITSNILLMVTGSGGAFSYQKIVHRHMVRIANQMIVANANELIFGASEAIVRRMGEYRASGRLKYSPNVFIDTELTESRS